MKLTKNQKMILQAKQQLEIKKAELSYSEYKASRKRKALIRFSMAAFIILLTIYFM